MLQHFYENGARLKHEEDKLVRRWNGAFSKFQTPEENILLCLWYSERSLIQLTYKEQQELMLFLHQVLIKHLIKIMHFICINLILIMSLCGSTKIIFLWHVGIPHTVIGPDEIKWGGEVGRGQIMKGLESTLWNWSLW